MDRGAWQATVTKSPKEGQDMNEMMERTHTHTHTHSPINYPYPMRVLHLV